MEKLTIFALGPIIGLSIFYTITWFIDYVLESILGRGLHNDYLIWILIILLPLISYFIINKAVNFKEKIAKTLLFAGGVLFGFIIVFFLVFLSCPSAHPYLYPTMDCSPISLLVFVMLLGIDIGYLIFRFGIYLRSKNFKNKI